MRRRRVRNILLALGALLTVVCACQWYFDTSISAADVDRVQTGMTLTEVIATLRSPPTSVNGRLLPANANEPTWEEIAIPLGQARTHPLYRLDWERGSDMAMIFFDDTGHVYAKGYDRGSGLDGLRFWWMRLFGRRPPF